MATETTTPPPRSFRSHTLRVVDLLSTRVQSVRVELVGSESSTFTRLGAILLYLPVLLMGYGLVLVAFMNLLAPALGWGLTLFLFGGVHLGVSAWGLSRGRGPGAARTYDVVDPQLAASPVAPMPVGRQPLAAARIAAPGRGTGTSSAAGKQGAAAPADLSGSRARPPS